MGNKGLGSLYKEIGELEVLLNKKRNEYAREALRENGGAIELTYNPYYEDFNESDKSFEDQFPESIGITGSRYDVSVCITKVYEKYANGRSYLLMDGIDLNTMNKYEGYVAYNIDIICDFINYCLNQKEDEKAQEIKSEAVEINRPISSSCTGKGYNGRIVCPNCYGENIHSRTTGANYDILKYECDECGKIFDADEAERR